MPRLVEIYDDYGDRGFRVISINTGTPGAASDAFLEENNVRHIVLNDPKDEVSDEYRIVAIPVTVIIDHEGRVIFRHLGFAEEMVPRLRKEIETLLAWRGTT
ncbi:MAG: TlpA family protein disulfide reductase [Candidatus Eisenbacteria bacterium]|nr:TlpA family protein disulfide reductase [Candidatus Eisenbacteria bacterium]